MPYYLYSPEALPNPEFMGKPRYTPDNDYIKFAGVTLPPIPKKQWLKLDDEDPRYNTLRRADWRDRHGTAIEVPLKKFRPVIENPERGFAERGVVMLDHEPAPHEKKAIEAKSEELNMRWRKKCVEFFEQQRDNAKARQGTYEPTPYIDECYEMLEMRKPYSMEALRAQRDPGREAVKEMAEAITQTQERLIESVAALLTRPKSEPVASR